MKLKTSTPTVLSASVCLHVHNVQGQASPLICAFMWKSFLSPDVFQVYRQVGNLSEQKKKKFKMQKPFLAVFSLSLIVSVQLIIWDKRGRKDRCSDDKEIPAATVKEEEIHHSQHCAGEVAKLKEMLEQRDNEISILSHVAASLVQLQLIFLKKDLIFDTVVSVL